MNREKKTQNKSEMHSTSKMKEGGGEMESMKKKFSMNNKYITYLV